MPEANQIPRYAIERKEYVAVSVYTSSAFFDRLSTNNQDIF